MNDNKKNKIIFRIAESLNQDIASFASLSAQQTFYINHTLEKSSHLKACPGSGKTEVIGVKAAFEIKKWVNQFGGIAVTTFTNSAAEELSKRVRKYADLTSGLYPHFIGTFDSWLHNFLLQPHIHYVTGYSGIDGDKSLRIIDDDSDAGFLATYTVSVTRNNYPNKIGANEYHWDGQAFVGHTKNAKNIFVQAPTDIEKKLLLENKAKFLKAGFATYSETDWLCKAILEKFPFVAEKLFKRFPVIVVDECQDLSDGQIAILDILRSKGSTLHFVGDLNQSIYEFREVDPQSIQNYIDSNSFVTHSLTNNYRSCAPIVAVSDALIGNAVLSTAIPATIATTPCIIWQYTDLTFDLLPQKFEQLIADNNLTLTKCAILSRGKSTIESFRTQNRSGYSKSELFALSLHCYYIQNRTVSDLKNALHYLGRAICFLAYEGRGDSRNQYCPNNFSPIEWRLLLKKILGLMASLYPFEENTADLTWTRWIVKLKANLTVTWATLPGAVAFTSVTKKLRSKSGESNNLVKSLITVSAVRNNIRTATIHGVKGETLDAVLLVSNPTGHSQGGHYSHWFREGSYVEEHIRFAYVACSRPKHLLVIATPTLNAQQLAKFTNIGFVSQ